MFFVMAKKRGARGSKDVSRWTFNLFLIFSVVGMFFIAFASYDVPLLSGIGGEEGIHVSHEFIADDQVKISANVYFEDVVFLNSIQIFADDFLVEECTESQNGGDWPPGDDPENSPRFSGYSTSCEYTGTFSEGAHDYYGRYSTRILGMCSGGACTESTAVVASCPAWGDSDGGDPMVEGSVELGAIGVTIADTCFDSNYLKEYTCATENEFRVEFYECRFGCDGGRCLGTESPPPDGIYYYDEICQYDSPGGNDPNIAGEIGFDLANYDPIFDECENEVALWEYYCVGDYALGGVYVCDTPAVASNVSDVASFTVSFSGTGGDNPGGSNTDDNSQEGGNPEGNGCIEDWSCTEWTDCFEDQRTRECTDLDSCGTENNKPVEVENCGSSWDIFPFDLKNINWWYASAFIIVALLLVWFVVFMLRKKGWD
jgi:hypothetical protein